MNRTGSPTYSQEEMERDFSVFLGHIDSLGADEVTRLQMEYCDGLTSKVFETTDRELIVQWINLLKKSRFSVHPSDLIARGCLRADRNYKRLRGAFGVVYGPGCHHQQCCARRDRELQRVGRGV